MDALIEEAKKILLSTPSIILIPLSSYGHILMFGRGIEVLKNYKSKNLVAIILIIFWTVFREYLFLNNNKIHVIIWNSYIWSGLSFAVYALFLWRMFSRIDHWFDNKNLKDDWSGKNAKVRKKPRNTAK